METNKDAQVIHDSRLNEAKSHPKDHNDDEIYSLRTIQLRESPHAFSVMMAPLSLENWRWPR
jgi:hypothetical protein